MIRCVTALIALDETDKINLKALQNIVQAIVWSFKMQFNHEKNAKNFAGTRFYENYFR